MPFTPFHMGPALLLKPVLKHRFSLIVFGTSQVLMDIEPGVGMLRDSEVLHGPSHTLLGALIIALASVPIGRWLAPFLLHIWNRELNHHRLQGLNVPVSVSWRVAMASALLGTLSHLLFDALMHVDMRPLAPFSEHNPILFLLPVMQVYGLTFMLGAIGVLCWLVKAIMVRCSANRRVGEGP